MSDLSRRRLLSSIAMAPVAGALASTAAAQTGVYGKIAPPAKTASSETPYYNAPHATSTETLVERSRIAREQMRERHFPDVVLVNQDGKKVRFYTDLLKDKVMTLNFFYTDCEGICPGVTANLARVYKMFGNTMGNPLLMYSFTLKPQHDTPKVIKEYAKSVGAGPAWTFFTGNEEDIEKIRRGIGFVYSDPKIDADKSQHIGNIRYGNEALMQWGCCPGLTGASWLKTEISFVIPPRDGRRT